MLKTLLIIGLITGLMLPAMVKTSGLIPNQQTQALARDLTSVSITNNELPPIKVAVVVDKTLSTLDTGVPQLQLTDLDPLIDLLAARGGELAVGVIAPVGNEPLFRWYFTSPALKPVDSSRSETNLFRVGQARARHEEAMSNYREKKAERLRYIADIDRTMRQKLDTLLSLPPAAMLSDVAAVVQHVDECLSEPDTEWDIQPLKYALFCTDGLHTAGRAAPLSMKSRARIVTVSDGTLGILAPFKPIEFENPRAAVRFIVADAERTGNNQTTSAER